MGIKIVTANGQEVQSFEDWKNGGSFSGSGQQSSGYSGPQIVNSSGKAVQSFEDWRRQRQGNAEMFSSSSKIQRNQPASKADSLQNQWLKKYQGKGYNSLAASLLELEDGDEKNWLTSYAAQVDYDEKRNLDTSAYEKAIRDLERQVTEYPDYDWTDVNQRRKASDDLDALQKEIDQRKQYLTQAKRIQEQAASKDKYKQMTSRKDFSQKSGFDSDNQEIGYQYVNADASGRSDLEQKYGRYATQFADIGIDSMNDEERSIYNYYMNSGDREEAARYLQYLEETLQIRKGTEADAAMDALVEEDPRAKALRYAFMANVGYDQHLSGMRGAGNMIAGKDGYVPPSATQVAGQLVREDLAQDGKQLPQWLGGGSTGQMVGDLISTTANMAPSMAVGLVSPGAGAAMMGASAAGSAYQEKLNEGYSKDQARKYGIAVGASETALGAALSGIKTLGGAVTNNVIENALKGVKSGLGRFLVEWGSRIGSEALEEGVQTILEPLFSKWLLNTDEAVDWGEVAYSALLGGLSAGVLEGPSAVSNAKNVTDAPNNVTTTPDNVTKASDNGTGASSNTTVSKMETVQLTGDIDSFARQFGKQAEVVKQNYLEGQDLQEYEVGFQAAFAIGREGGKAEALTEQNVPYLTRSQREIAFSMGRDAAMAEKTAEEKTAPAKGNLLLQQTAHLITEDGSDGGTVTIVEIESMDENGMTFQLDDGRTVTDEELDFPEGAEVYSAVMDLGMDAESANAVVRASASATQPRAAVAEGIKTAYRHGKYGYGMEALLKTQEAAGLPESVLRESYLAGEKYRQQSRETAQSEEAMVGRKVVGTEVKGNVYFAGDSDALNNVQRESLRGLEWIADLTGAQIYVEDISNDRNLSRINGQYDPADDSIHIDLRAGSDGTGTLLYTAAHEFTHRMKQNNEAAFFRLADFLVAEYGKKGIATDSLVKQQMADTAADGIDLNYDEAFEEMVSDAMEAMFTDTDALAKMEKLKTQDKSIWQEIKDFVLGLAEKIRAAYSRLKPDSAEARYVLQMKESLDQMAQLFAEGVMESKTEKNTTPEGGAKLRYSVRSSFASELQDWFNSTTHEERKVSGKRFLVGTTTDVLKSIGVKDYQIYFGGSKIDKILENNTSMTLDTIKQAVQLLEDPILIMQSRTVEDSIVLFGEVYTEGDKPVMISLLLNPKTKNGEVLDYAVITSTYGRRSSNVQNLINNSTIYYVNENKNRTEKWLQALGLQLPSAITKFGSITSIPGSNEEVNQKFSRRKQTETESLRQQNEKLREDVERLQELVKLQGKVTNGKIMQPSSVEAAAKYLKKLFHTDGDTKELAKLLNDFYKYIASDPELTWEGVKEQAAPVVDWLQENEKFQRSQYAQDILDALKGQRFYLDETQLGEAKSQYGSVANYRRAVKNMASSKASQSLDQLWQELSSQYPDIFSPEISASDMPVAFAEAVERLEGIENTESSMDWRLKDQTMLEAVYDSYWRVSGLETVADKYSKKIFEIRGKHYAKMTELRRDRDQKLKEAQTRKEKVVQTMRDNREKAFLRKKVEKVVNTLNNLLTNPTKTSHVLPKLQKPVAEMLDALNMGTAEKQDAISRQIQRYQNLLAEEIAKSDPQLDIVEAYKAKIERLQDRGKSVSDNLARLKSAYADIKNSTDPEVAGAYMPEIEEQLDIMHEEVGDTPLQDMSLEQLDIVYTAYKMVLHNVTHANRLLGKLQKITAAEMTKEAATQIRSNGIDTKDPPKGLKKASDKVNEMSWQNLRPVDAFRRLGSEKMMDLFWGLVDGMNERGKMTREIRDYLVKARHDSNYSKFNLKKADSYTTVDGKEMRLTLGEKMSIYAYSKREAAFDHMTTGGFTYAEAQAYKDDNGVTRYHNNAGGTWRLSLEDLENICNSLTAEQKQYADAMQKFLTEFGQKGNKVSRALFGIDLFKEQNYFPLMSNHDYLNSVQTDLGATQTAASLKNSGFTKSTTPGANNPIVLKNFDDVCLEHLDKMMNYIALTLPLENLRKVYDNVVSASADTEPQSTKALIGAVYGKSAQKYFDQFLKDANGTRAMTGAKNPLASLFRKSKAAAVSANVSVMIQQISAVVRASAEISPAHLVFARGYGKGITRGKQSYKEMMTYSGIANIKDMGGYDVGSSTGLKDYLGMEEAPISSEKAWNIAQDVFGFGAEFMDKVGWTMIWNAVKREVASRKQYTVNSAEFFQACADRFEEVVVKTQVFDSVLSRSGYMRSDNDSVKYLTSFMGEPTVTAGMVFNSHLEVLRAVKNQKNVGYHVGKLVRTDAALIVTLLLNGMLKALPYAARDDDEDESYWERWARHFGDSLRGDLNPLNLLPVARDISSILEGRTIDRPDLALLADLITTGKKAAKALMDEDAREELQSEDYWQLAEDVLGAIGNLAGVPVQNIWRDAESYLRIIKDVRDGIKTVELRESLERGLRGEKKTKLQGIYDAMVSGDTARLDALKATYKTDGSYESAVRKALRLHDPRIKEMANARYEGDYDRLEALSYEIEAEGIFDMAIIRATYEAERTAQAKERGITLEEDSAAEQGKESTVFSMEEYYAAIRSGSNDGIQTAYNALVEEKKQEYYLEREAEDSIASSVTSKVKGEYLDEDISRADAKSILTKYGGKSKAEAETEIKKWEFQMEYHYAWGSRDRCYRSGTITRSQLVSAVMDIEDASREEAQEYVDFLELEMQNEKVDITASEASSYFEHAKPHGISVEVYLDYKARTKGIQNDKDADGDSVPYSAVQKKMAVINSMPLTRYQKDVLAKGEGWADSTIQKYKQW